MINLEPLLTAQRIATVAFHGMKDKGGRPYIEHCLRVEAKLPPEATIDERCAAILHDVLEDTDLTDHDLYEAGMSERTVHLVEMLTRKKDTTYMDYIRDIKSTGDIGLINIKLADNADNSDPARIAQLPPDEQGITKRYERARRILMGGA